MATSSYAGPVTRRSRPDLSSGLEPCVTAPARITTSGPSPFLDRKASLPGLHGLVGNEGVRRLVQRALRVGPAGDAYEREAEAMADDVMRNWGSGAPPVTEHPDADARRDARRAQVRRATGEGVGLEGGTVDRETEARISRVQGGGQPLPAGVRQPMEGALGADFSAVRVHSGPDSVGLNRSMQARAFTVGSDIFFARDEYRPETTPGRRLLAHELTHTIQQGAARQLEI